MKSLTTFAALFLSATILIAQGTQSNPEPAEFNSHCTAIFGTLGLPSGDFAKNSPDNLGKAKTGFGLGITKTTEINSRVSFIVEGRFIYNSLETSPIEEVIRGSGASIDESGYQTFWALLGFQFNSMLNSDSRVYIKGLGGFVYGISPKVEVSLGGETVEPIKSAYAANLGFGFGGGLVISDKILLDVTFLSGKPEYTIESEVIKETIKKKIEHSIFTINLGIVF